MTREEFITLKPGDKLLIKHTWITPVNLPPFVAIVVSINDQEFSLWYLHDGHHYHALLADVVGRLESVAEILPQLLRTYT